MIFNFYLPAQQVNEKFKGYIHKNKKVLLNEFKEFLSIPNIAADSVNIFRNAYFIKKMLHNRGLSAELLSADVPGSSPVVFAEIKKPGATKTIIFYAHYDGQPVNEKNWAQGLAPFSPQLANDRLDRNGKIIDFPNDNNIKDEWRLYARSSSDDKTGVFAIIAGYEAAIKSEVDLNANIKFFFEGEEEAGSTNLGRILLKYKDKLAADLWIICDGPRHVSGRKQVVFGVRGDMNVELKVYGPKRPLHSGNYGNWAPNPAMQLVQLLASMKDKNGYVTIDGFYDDVIPLSEQEKKAIADIPGIEETLKDEFKIARPDGEGKPFLELLSLPSLNINGIQSANVGSMAANVIPSIAIAELDLRLVPGNDVDRQLEKLKDHIRKQGFYIVDKEPTDEELSNHGPVVKVSTVGSAYNAQRTSMDLPIAKVVANRVQATSSEKIVLLPSLGGSLPLYLFEQYLDTKPITVTIVNYDNNQHAENENIMLRFLWEAIEIVAAIMTGEY